MLITPFRRLGAAARLPVLDLLRFDLAFDFAFDFAFFGMAGHVQSWIEYICPKTCIARTGPAITRRKDRYQLRVASASQPKMLKTYACARDCTPRCCARRC